MNLQLMNHEYIKKQLMGSKCFNFGCSLRVLLDLHSMSSTDFATNIFKQIQSKTTFLSSNFIAKLCKTIAVSSLFLYIFYIFLSNHPCCQSSSLFVNLRHKWTKSYPIITDSPTNISHLVFGIAGSSNTWKNKKPYIESWWQPNKTRGYLFLDRDPKEYLPWPPSSPPFRVSADTSMYKPYNKHPMPYAIRMVRVILETFKEAKNDYKDGVRWYVMADDDTILFVDNLVEVLGRYDHKKYFYIGMNSECIQSNVDNSFEMAFGGAGYALSYPLAEAVAKNLDVCIKRYPTLYGSDHILQSCIADIGVSLTQEKGFHQIDLHNDLWGLLSSHPQSPFLSLHHLNVVNPIFPSMDRYESVKQLMKAAKADESRLLQQTICYDKNYNWSLSISWGYTTQIYEKIYPPSLLQKPLQTFTHWRRAPRPYFLFNIRFPSNNPCEDPHVFFLESVEKTRWNNQYVTSYTRRWPRKLPACSSSGNHSAGHISTIRVFSPLTRRDIEGGTRRECCDVIQESADKNVTMVKLRDCMKDEIVG